MSIFSPDTTHTTDQTGEPFEAINAGPHHAALSTHIKIFLSET